MAEPNFLHPVSRLFIYGESGKLMVIAIRKMEVSYAGRIEM